MAGGNEFEDEKCMYGNVSFQDTKKLGSNVSFCGCKEWEWLHCRNFPLSNFCIGNFKDQHSI